MNRKEFMRQLESLLTSISQSEKEEAIQYYNDYFDDAGTENEGDVIKALGSPAKVAETIKASLSGKNQEDFEFTERGVNPNAMRQNEVVVSNVESKDANQKNQNGYGSQGNPNGYRSQYQNHQGNQNHQNTASGNQRQDAGKIILIVALLILTSFIWIPIASGIFGILIAIAAAIIGVFIAIAASGVALVLSGIVIFGVSIAKFFVSPLIGVFLFGASLLVTGIGILFLLLTVWIGGTLIPLFFRGVVALCRMPFERKGGQVA